MLKSLLLYKNGEVLDVLDTKEMIMNKKVEVTVKDIVLDNWIDGLEEKLINPGAQKVKANDLAILIEHFDKQGWNWDIARFGKMITSPVYDGKYYYFPDWLDKTNIPQEGLQRLNALEELGIEVQGVIIGHEVKKPEKNRAIEIDWMELGQRAKNVAKTSTLVTAGVVGTVVGGLLIGLATLLAMPITFLDPMIIVVLNDEANTNVEIYYWDTK